MGRWGAGGDGELGELGSWGAGGDNRINDKSKIQNLKSNDG